MEVPAFWDFQDGQEDLVRAVGLDPAAPLSASQLAIPFVARGWNVEDITDSAITLTITYDDNRAVLRFIR